MVSFMSRQPATVLRTGVAFILGCVLSLLVSGCASTPEASPRKPPDVRLGPLLHLLHLLQASSKLDKVRVIPTAADTVHVLVASNTLKQVFDITVGPDGVVAQQMIRTGITPATMDGAIDARGQLHIVIDAEHLVLEGNVWRTSTRSVWQDAGIKVENPGFVHGTHDLIWTFTAFGRDMGVTPGRWVWRGGGGGYPAGAFLLFPWYEQTRKAVLVADGTGKPWSVPDAQGKVDTLIMHAVADAAGTVYLVYASGYNADLAGTDSLLSGVVTRGAGKITLHYARVAAKDLQAVIPGVPDSSVQIRLLRGIAGSRQLDWPYARIALAVDPVSGSALLGDRFLVSGERWIDVNANSPFTLGSPPEQLAAAGDDSFHAIAVGNIDHRFMGRSGIKYAMFSKGEWSVPLWLSIAGTLPLLDPTVVSMASTSNGNAFVVWTAQTGFVGRWIEQVR